MKVIEIYNKIANGEEIPKFEIGGGTYFMGENGFLSEEDTGLTKWSVYKEWLNRDIKIIEENKRNELKKLDEEDFGDNKNFADVDYDLEHLVDKINEIIEFSGNKD